MTARAKSTSKCLTRIAQDSPKMRDATSSLRTETTAPCSDEEASPGKQTLRVKVKVKKSSSRDHSLNAIELEQMIRNLQKKGRTENKSHSSNKQPDHAWQPFLDSFPGDLPLSEPKDDKNDNTKQHHKPRALSTSRHQRSSSLERTRDPHTRRKSHTDQPSTSRSNKSSHSRRPERSATPLGQTPRTPRSTKSKRSSVAGLAKSPTTPLTPNRTRVSSRRNERGEEEEIPRRRSVHRTRSNDLEYFTPEDVLRFPDPWAQSDNRVNDLVLQSGIITANQLKQLLNAGFTFNAPEILEAFP